MSFSILDLWILFLVVLVLVAAVIAVIVIIRANQSKGAVQTGGLANPGLRVTVQT